MARGWESKSVEAQQDAASESRRVGPQLSREQAALEAKRATLQLARSRAIADLAAATAPAHRLMLEQTIAELDRHLSAAGRR
jgi:hypothetical protein